MKSLLLHFLFTLCLLLVASCKESSQDTVQINEKELPNIVLIISDDQAWTDYGFMGHNHIETPHIDQLARESLTFTRMYPTSLCAPSLATIITGLYPRHHKVLGNDRYLPGNDLKNRKEWRSRNYEPVIEHFRTLTTLPEMLKEKNYLSFQTGKWWLGDFTHGGFDKGMTHGDPERGGRHGDYGLEIGRKGMDTPFQLY